MANNNDMEYPKLRQIPGTNMFWKLVTTGSSNGKSGYENYDAHWRKKWGLSVEEDSNTHRMSRGIQIYKLPEDSTMSIEEAVKNNSAVLVGYLTFEASKNNLEQGVDINGNLLLKAMGFGLTHDKDYYGDEENLSAKGGNVLMTADGEILVSPMKPNGDRNIFPASENGYYYVEIFKTNNPYMGEPEVVDIEYNFLTPDGSFVRQSSFAKRNSSNQTMPKKDSLSLVHSIKSSNKYLGDSYIVDSFYNDSGHPEFFVNVVDVLTANRQSGRPILDGQDEEKLMRKMFERGQQLPVLINNLDGRFYEPKRGAKVMSAENYEDLRAQLEAEMKLIEHFKGNFMTRSEREYYLQQLEDKLM